MSTAPLERDVTDADAMAALGAALAAACPDGTVVHLHGELGTGKTTLVRGFIRGLGHDGAVKSPTYTLLEPYPVGARTAYHLDLYRLSDPGELEWLGLRDLLTPDSICLVEWPERGAGALPAPDLRLDLAYGGGGRRVRLTAHSPRGEALLAGLGAAPPTG